MTDIVERLWAGDRSTVLRQQSADEITRLRAENERLREKLDD